MDVIEIEYQWIVKNSEFRLKKFPENISSPFSFKTTRECKWNIMFFPQGDKESNRNYVAIYLNSLNDFDIQIHFTISISKCKTNKILSTMGTKYTFESGTAFGFGKIINYGVVANDDIKIICKINTQGDESSIKAINDEMKLELLESQCYLKEFEKFGELLYSGDFSDIIIKVNEKEFKAHKCILASKSSVFKAMFNNNVKENLDNIIEIIDIESAVMEEVLFFMYTGKMKQTSIAMKMKIFIAADKYFLDGLKDICIKQLSKNITVKNVLEIFDFARSSDHDGLQKDCIKFIGEHTSELLKN